MKNSLNQQTYMYKVTGICSETLTLKSQQEEEAASQLGRRKGDKKKRRVERTGREIKLPPNRGLGGKAGVGRAVGK